MAFEILNVAQTTPRRLLTLLRLMGRYPEIERERLLNLLQPPPLGEGQEAAKAVVNSAINLGLISEDPHHRHHYLLIPDPRRFATEDAYRILMQETILGETNYLNSNYLFSEYLAWYAAQNARVLRFSRDDFHIKFNEALHPDKQDEQAFNSTKFGAWRTWAAFLGCGWLYQLYRGNAMPYLVPDATGRLSPLIDRLLPESGERLTLRAFIDHLSEWCPELDGGILFERVSRDSVSAGNQLSLMLSNALRRLEDSGAITLEDISDASDRWRLHPSTGSPRHYLTHVRRGGS